MVIVDNFDYEAAQECYNTIEINDILLPLPNNYANTVEKRLVSVIHMNIRSLNKNFDEFAYTIENCHLKFDVIVLSETWMGEGEPFNYVLNNYTSIDQPGKRNKKNGVCVFVRNSFTFNNLNVNIVESDSLTLKIKNPTTNFEITLIAIYRSPSLSADLFLNGLESALGELRTHDNILLVGDININLNQVTDTCIEYFNIMSSNGFTSYINKPTRVQNTSSSCIDHIFFKNTNVNADRVIGSIFKTDITDHYCTSIHLGDQNTACNSNNISHNTSTIEKIDYNKLLQALKTENWANVINNNNVHTMVQCFEQTLITHIGNSTTKIKISHRNRPLKNWITQGLIRAIQTRNKMHKKLLKQPNNNELKECYTRYRNTLNKLLKETKINYYRDKLDQSKGNARKTWNTINEILDLKKKSLKNDIDPEVLNKHFSSIGRKLAEKLSNENGNIHPQTRQRYSHNPQIDLQNSFFLFPTNELEIIQTIKELKSNSAPGINNISNSCLKKIAHYVAKPINIIINKCFEEGFFPDEFKIAKIVPLYKSGDAKNPTNYRPISLLSGLSKVMEKIIKRRLIRYLKAKNLIHPSQFGFQEGKNTEDAISMLVKTLTENFGRGKKSIAIFMDLTKAFDTIPHSKLLEKLNCIGIRGLPLNLFSSYLGGRSQILSNGNKFSTEYILDYGLPQGTVLSPILFLIYINDLLNLNLDNGQAISFADDTTLIFSGESWDAARASAEKGFLVVKAWLDNHTLTLNYKKSSFMTFTPNAATQPVNQLTLKIHKYDCDELDSQVSGCDCPSLEDSKYVKYLGVMIDQHLRWDSHIQSLCHKTKFLINKFYRISQLKLPQLAKMTYFAYAQSVLQYGIRVWGGAAERHISKVFNLQKHIIKVALNKPRLYPTRTLFQESSILSIKQLYLKNLTLYLINNKNLFNTRVTPYNTRRIFWTSNLIETNLSVCRMQFPYRCERLVNLIPHELLANSPISKLKKKTITWIKTSTDIFGNIIL